MALTRLGSMTLGRINVGLSTGLGLLGPLAAELDLLLTGKFGIGALLADIQAQYGAAIAAQAGLQAQISNPLLAVQTAITAFAQLSASLQSALALGVPQLSLQLSGQATAAGALAGTLQAKVGGIRALVSAALRAKLRALEFAADAAGALGAGPVHLLSFSGSSLRQLGTELESKFAIGLGPEDPIAPSDVVSGIVLVTRDPAVFAAMSEILRTR